MRRYLPRDEYLAVIADSAVNLAPLCASPFNDCKSEIKFTEAAAVGTPTVASRTTGYVAAMTDGIDGLLATTEREWIDAIMFLLMNPEKHIVMGKKAMNQVEQQRYRCESVANHLSRIYVN